jgi:phage tail tape-measure protein
MSDVLTLEEVRQGFCERVPAFQMIACDSLGVDQGEFHKLVAEGRLTKTELIEHLVVTIAQSKFGIPLVRSDHDAK